MKPLKPFFSYFGSKYNLAKHYPSPKHNILIEPFAGSACYALHYPNKQVKLYDKYDVICGIWDYLIHASEKEILDLPMIDFDKSVNDYNICQEAKWLIGYWIHTSNYRPDTKWTSRCKSSAQGYIAKNGDVFKPRNYNTWTELNKIKIASQVQHIRHWTIEQKSYDQIDNGDACWFIDPPYEYEGKGYVHGSLKIDYEHLGNWCREREGEVIVCEGEKATWLPFEPMRTILNNQKEEFKEMVYYQNVRLNKQEELFNF
jgi:site-specific DNA-adenine methylase